MHPKLITLSILARISLSSGGSPHDDSAPHDNSPVPSESTTSSEDLTAEASAFPVPKLSHHRQFAAPIHPSANPIGYNSDKIESYAPPTPNSNLVGLSPPVHPTYFTYNGQDQGQKRRVFGSQNVENRVEPHVPEQLQPFAAPVEFNRNQNRGRFDGRQRVAVPEDSHTVKTPEVPDSGVRAPEPPQSRFHPKTAEHPRPLVQPLEGFEKIVRPAVASGVPNLPVGRQASESGILENRRLPTVTPSEPRQNFQERRPEVIPQMPRPAESFGRRAPESAGRVEVSTESFGRRPIAPESPESSRRPEVTPQTPKPSESSRRPEVTTESVERRQHFNSALDSFKTSPEERRHPESSVTRQNAPEARASIHINSQHARAPESHILGHAAASTFPHRFVTSPPPTVAPVKPWYQSTSTPWWLRNPTTSGAPNKKKPELKIEKLDKVQEVQVPPRFNFDPARYTFYNGDYYGPTIPGIRVNQTDGGFFVQGGTSDADKKEAQEAFEQFKQLSKGFQQEAHKFLENERAQGRAVPRGSFVIGSVRTGGEFEHGFSSALHQSQKPLESMNLEFSF